MQAVAFECACLDSPPVQVATYLYVQHPPENDCTFTLEFFTRADPHTPYQGKNSELNDLAARLHGQAFKEDSIADAFKLYWQLHDLITAQVDLENRAAKFAEGVSLGLVPFLP